MNPRKRLRWAALSAAMLVVVTLVGSSGCAAMAAGGPVAYVRGDLDATLNAPFEMAWRAANVAVEQLEFSKVSQRKDALQAIVVARNAADKRVEIRIERSAESATKLKIRVGAFGDETVSIATYLKISANL